MYIYYNLSTYLKTERVQVVEIITRGGYGLINLEQSTPWSSIADLVTQLPRSRFNTRTIKLDKPLFALIDCGR